MSKINLLVSVINTSVTPIAKAAHSGKRLLVQNSKGETTMYKGTSRVEVLRPELCAWASELGIEYTKRTNSRTLANKIFKKLSS